MSGRRGLLASSKRQGGLKKRKLWKNELASGSDSSSDDGIDLAAARSKGCSDAGGDAERRAGDSVAPPPAAEDRRPLFRGLPSQSGPPRGTTALSGAEEEAGGQDESSEEAKRKQKREKAFAWMDSGDESNASSNEEAVGKESDSGKEGTEATEATLPERIEEVQTLGEFVRITPALVRAVGSISVEQLVALCATAVRLRYFDGDLFREVYKVVTRRFITNEIDVSAATNIAQHLADLNAYDEKVFSAAIACLHPRIHLLNKEQRLRWLSLLEQVNHRGSAVFVEALRSAPVPEDLPVTTSSTGRIPCRHFARGFCAMGRACTFAHETGLTPPPMPNPTVLTQTQLSMEKRSGPYAGKPPCRHHARGFCAMGKQCAFPHITDGGLVVGPEVLMPGLVAQVAFVNGAAMPVPQVVWPPASRQPPPAVKSKVC